MRILIDIGHPGHVHLFKNFAKQMQQKGHSILFTCRQKEFETELLEAERLRYKTFGSHRHTKAGKIFGLLKFNLMMLLLALKYRPHIFLSHGSIYAAQVAWLLRKPHISMEDSGNMEQIRLYRPFTKCILTPSVLPWKFGKKQINYEGYHELAYLHPNWYNPDPFVKDALHLDAKNHYAILRFVSWNATHDYGQRGLSNQMKRELVDYLSQHMKVFITSETTLPADLKRYQIQLPPEKLHDALFFSEIVVSEGATIASEAGILGTPAIFINSIKTYNNLDQENNYGTVFNLSQEDGILDKVRDIIRNKAKVSDKHKRIIKDKIDVTAFLIWFIESYPDSFRIMKENPDYQYRFK